ncbi:hypothetical protein ACFP2T_40355 [Plantactinospora solaniradicis]|uniref:WXG100 family type VII secretion target n=1 Tax=Plantactinospora solaniradicis TaxID=1723736 RepID=A0ABW1KM79_9ACTN
MGDYNYYSEKSIQVATEAIRVEAKKWHGLSDKMATISRETSNLDLEITAFLVTDATGAVTAYDLKHAYDQMHGLLDKVLKQAVTELDQFGNALYKIADWYEDSDQNSVARMEKFWTA